MSEDEIIAMDATAPAIVEPVVVETPLATTSVVESETIPALDEPTADQPNEDHPLKYLEDEAVAIFHGAEVDVKKVLAWVASKL